MGVSHDQHDFGAFFADSWESCLRAVAASTGDPALAEDQVAEAFARAFANWPKVRRHPAPQAWVVRTALNAGASWWRRRSKETPLGEHDVTATTAAHEAGLDAPMLLALRRLPVRQREVVVFRVFLDLDIDTTARELGIAPGTVRAHLARAMSTLRGALTPITSLESRL